jgi:hypothetical protein
MEEIFMTDEESNDPNWEFGKFFADMRKSASIRAGAAMFGEAQSVYYDTLKEHMSDEEAYNMLAHTTECLLRSVASAVGPLANAILSAEALMRFMGVNNAEETTDKEVPGKSS